MKKNTRAYDFRPKALTLVYAMSLVVASLAVTTPAQAKDSKMATCNKESAGKTGDERKAFMSQCLSAKPAKISQQDRMRNCNKDATGKKGDERKAFMKTCLSGG